MGNQDKEKKRQRVNSSDTKAEANQEAMDSHDGALISLMVTEYQVLTAKITSLKDKHKLSDNRILRLEARLDEAQVEIDSLKKQLGLTLKAVDEIKELLEFTQREHSDLTEHVTMCETEQSPQWNKITHQSIYNRRWNLIFDCVMESPEENCTALVKNVLNQQLPLRAQIVQSMKFCGTHQHQGAVLFSPYSCFHCSNYYSHHHQYYYHYYYYYHHH